eukprot:7022014-Pyramimonas_sp.AAC.1
MKDPGAPKVSPAPGARLTPPFIADGRLGAVQKDAKFTCDACGRAGLKSTFGTWENDEARELLAHN